MLKDTLAVKPVRPILEREVEVRAATATLTGALTVPPGASGVVIFIHGSGSHRNSPRNMYAARVLSRAGIATAMFDLLTTDEETKAANVFDIELLAGRLAAVTAWVHAQPWAAGLPIGWFGTGTGAGAALRAAADPDADVCAVISRDGRPDLARAHLSKVRAPTLLIVGEDDDPLVELNREAAAALRCPHELAIVPAASITSQEPTTVGAMAKLVRGWFTRHLRNPAAPRAQRSRHK